MSRIGNLVGRALRETGQAMDRLALKIEGNEIYRDTFTRHRAVMSLFGKVRRRMIAHQRKKIRHQFHVKLLSLLPLKKESASHEDMN